MDTHDVIVVGGGPAGLQAALTLGRMHRDVLLLDSGTYRNDPAPHLHNFITHDGRPPADLRAAARADLAAYDTVTLRDARASAAAVDETGVRVTVDGVDVGARALVLATGVRDTLPEKPGLAELFGTVAAHCPFCHGHEHAGRHVGILGNGPHVAMLAALLGPIAGRLTVLADGAPLDPDTAKALADAGVVVRPEAVTGVRRSGEGAAVELVGGEVEVGGLFVSTTISQAAPFAEQLGLELLPSGCVRVDELGRTSRPGVWAAGDLAHLPALPAPMASVLTAAAAGLLAGASVQQALTSDSWGRR